MSDCSPGPSSATLLTPEREQHQRIDLSLCFFCQREKDSTGKSRLASTEAGRACVIETSNLLQDGKMSALSDNDLTVSNIMLEHVTLLTRKKVKGIRKNSLKQVKNERLILPFHLLCLARHADPNDRNL